VGELPTILGFGEGSGHRWFDGEDLRTGSVDWGRGGVAVVSGGEAQWQWQR
jgi:hypothetical protein